MIEDIHGNKTPGHFPNFISPHQPAKNIRAISHLVEQGVWIRPFGKLVYIMPPYGMEPDDLSQLTRAMAAVAEL